MCPESYGAKRVSSCLDLVGSSYSAHQATQLSDELPLALSPTPQYKAQHTILIVTSKTWIRESRSKETCWIVSRTAFSKPALSPRICSYQRSTHAQGLLAATTHRKCVERVDESQDVVAHHVVDSRILLSTTSAPASRRRLSSCDARTSGCSRSCPCGLQLKGSTSSAGKPTPVDPAELSARCKLRQGAITNVCTSGRRAARFPLLALVARVSVQTSRKPTRLEARGRGQQGRGTRWGAATGPSLVLPAPGEILRDPRWV
jgi:hypothetical protein